MAEVSTIHLKGPWGPNGLDRHKGFVETRGEFVTVCDRDGYGAKRDSYPLANVQRIEWGTGW